MSPVELPWHLLPSPLAFLHLEVTGFSPTHDRVCRVGLVRLAPKDVPRWLSSDIADAPSAALPVPGFANLVPELRSLMEGAVVVSHLSRLQDTFMQRELERVGGHWGAPTLCTLELARAFLPAHCNLSLRALCRRFSAPAAMEDSLGRAMSTARALQGLVHCASTHEAAAEEVRKRVRIPSESTRWPPIAGSVMPRARLKLPQPQRAES